jgi:hypothetical protein
MKRLIEKMSVLRVGHRLPLRNLTDEPLTVFRERHHRRRRPPALLVHDHGRLAASITATTELVV